MSNLAGNLNFVPVIFKPDILLDPSATDRQCSLLLKAMLLVTRDKSCDQYIIGIDTYVRKALYKSNFEADKLEVISKWIDKMVKKLDLVEEPNETSKLILAMLDNEQFLMCKNAIIVIKKIFELLGFKKTIEKRLYICREDWISIYRPLLNSDEPWVSKVLEFLTEHESEIIIYKAPYFNHSLNRFIKVVIRFVLREYPSMQKNRARKSAIHIPDETELGRCLTIINEIIKS